MTPTGGDLGLPERRQPGGGEADRADRRGRRRTGSYRWRRLGLDHVAGPAALAGPAPARPLRRRIHGLGMLSDWIAYRLAGVQATEPSCGSSSGMFSLACRTWSPEIAQICGIDPPCCPRWPTRARSSARHRAGRRADRPAAGHPGGGGRRRHSARPARRGRPGGRVHGRRRHLLAEHGAAGPAAHRPGDPAAHAVPRHRRANGCSRASGSTAAWPCAGSGTPSATARSAVARSRGVDPYVVMEEAAAGMPPGSERRRSPSCRT